MHRRTLELIEEQTERARAGRPARIFAKLNALVDYRIIEALYRASQAGVPIELIVRGICCLRPGLPGISDNIRVTSIVGRFLEHSRLYVFSPDDEAQVFLSSADWMPRNFHRRVEVMFPIEADDLKRRVFDEVIPTYRRDNVRARILLADGSYVRAERPPDEPPHRAQEEFLAMREAAPERDPAGANGENGAAGIHRLAPAVRSTGE
jgi:polyphosphate kinase